MRKFAPVSNKNGSDESILRGSVSAATLLVYGGIAGLLAASPAHAQLLRGALDTAGGGILGTGLTVGTTSPGTGVLGTGLNVGTTGTNNGVLGTGLPSGLITSS